MARYACPECHSLHNLFITVETVARLVQDDDADEYETEIIDSVHWWDGEASVTCYSCGWSGLVKQLADPFKDNGNGP